MDTEAGHRIVTGRLAPSPTGSLHVGHAFAFLAAWWSARKQGGTIILRHEDVDVERAKPEHILSVEEDLRWLGLDWDARRVQSERIDELVGRAYELAQKNLAYPCVCTRSDVARAQEFLGAPQQGQIEQPYPGTCARRFMSVDAARALGPAGLRFRTPQGVVTFNDAIFGDYAASPQMQVGDFLILRRSGLPAYQLAIVVDDANDCVTEVVRGRDLLDSTARQIQLARALGIPSPSYAHLPLICDHQGKRLAKREDALSIRALRAAGVEPWQVVSWVARALDMALPAGKVTAAELVPRYDHSRVLQHDICLSESPLDDFLALRT